MLGTVSGEPVSVLDADGILKFGVSPIRAYACHLAVEEILCSKDKTVHVESLVRVVGELDVLLSYGCAVGLVQSSGEEDLFNQDVAGIYIPPALLYSNLCKFFVVGSKDEHFCLPVFSGCILCNCQDNGLLGAVTHGDKAVFRSGYFVNIALGSVNCQFFCSCANVNYLFCGVCRNLGTGLYN